MEEEKRMRNNEREREGRGRKKKKKEGGREAEIQRGERMGVREGRKEGEATE